MNAVKEEIAKDIAFGRNLTLEQFVDKHEFHEMLVEHIKRKEKRPAVGTYDPVSPKVNIEVDFSKAQGREIPNYDLIDDQDIEGDVLILDPDKNKKRLPDIKFDKQTGRTEPKIDSEDINNH